MGKRNLLPFLEGGKILEESVVISPAVNLAPQMMAIEPAVAGWTSVSVILLSCLAFSIGVISTYFYFRSNTKDKPDINELQKKLEKSDQNHKRYQQEVSQHFITISHLTANVTQGYRDINEQLVSSAMRLASPEIGRQLLKSGGSDLSLLDPNGNPLVEMDDVEVPRDYAPKVPGGILSEEYGLKDNHGNSQLDTSTNNIDTLASIELDPTENVG